MIRGQRHDNDGITMRETERERQVRGGRTCRSSEHLLERNVVTGVAGVTPRVRHLSQGMILRRAADVYLYTSHATIGNDRRPRRYVTVLSCYGTLSSARFQVAVPAPCGRRECYGFLLFFHGDSSRVQCVFSGSSKRLSE